MKFLHAADIHLDSPLRGLTRYDGAPVEELRSATRRALQNLVQLAIDDNVDFVLIAGDVYDGDWKDHNTGLYFVSQMTRLREAGIPVVMISGNHDAENRMSRSLRLPDNVVHLSHKKAETASLQKLHELGVAIHGKSFARAAEYNNLVDGYPSCIAGMVNIGVLHTSLAGAEGHEPYAPCTLNDLRRKEYDYWALGHVHTREIVCEDPFVIFPGNIQGRHIRESGEKGCYVVTVDDTGQCHPEFRPLDVLRWHQLSVNVTDAQSGDDVLDICSDALSELHDCGSGMPLAVRIVLTGRSRVHQMLQARPEHWINQIRGVAMPATNGHAWIEKVRFRTSPFNIEKSAEDDDGPLAALVRTIRDLQADPTALVRQSTGLTDLKKKLPDAVMSGPDGVRLDEPAYLVEMLNEVESMLLERIAEGSGE